MRVVYWFLGAVGGALLSASITEYAKGRWILGTGLLAIGFSVGCLGGLLADCGDNDRNLKP